MVRRKVNKLMDATRILESFSENSVIAKKNALFLAFAVMYIDKILGQLSAAYVKTKNELVTVEYRQPL